MSDTEVRVFPGILGSILRTVGKKKMEHCGQVQVGSRIILYSVFGSTMSELGITEVESFSWIPKGTI